MFERGDVRGQPSDHLESAAFGIGEEIIGPVMGASEGAAKVGTGLISGSVHDAPPGLSVPALLIIHARRHGTVHDLQARDGIDPAEGEKCSDYQPA
jgi:hypothetical protein